MLKIFHGIFFLVLVTICLICGCSSGTTNNSTANNYPVVAFSDIHFSPFYDPSLFQQLVTNDSSEWARIFKTSSITTPSAWGKDTNYPLLLLALSSIKQNLGASPLVIFTGDLLGHGIPQIFYNNINGTTSPRDLADVAAMKAFTDKTLAFVMGQVRESVGDIPVMFAVGNSDSYSGYGPNSPDSSFNQDSTFLPDTAELFYTKFLNGIVDHQEFLSTFTSGGYYSAEPPGTNVMVIGLNTIACTTLFYPVQGANDNAVATELDWLDSRLASAKVAGKKVLLLMHAPPGVDVTSTLKSPSNVPITTAIMMWWPAYQSRFLKILSNYPGTVSLTLAGHTHTDEYRILTASDTLEITPSIAPYFGNNPAFKVFTVSRDTFKPIDYSSVNYDLATNPSQFNSYYTFSAAYSVQGLLDALLTQLTPALVSNNSKQARYRGYFYSGHNEPNSITDTHINPVTNTNWPFYWCGIGKMEQQQFIDCVNSY
jgi:sphingomyelin phosphodiesterase acid-like 3